MAYVAELGSPNRQTAAQPTRQKPVLPWQQANQGPATFYPGPINPIQGPTQIAPGWSTIQNPMQGTPGAISGGWQLYPTAPGDTTKKDGDTTKTGGDTTKTGGDTKYDPRDDPYMKWLLEQKDTRIKGVKGQAVKKQKDILMGFGSKELARKILGDDPFVDLISDDPATGTSWLARTGFEYNRNVRDFNEEENAMNLFYGGGRIGGLANRARDRTLAIGDMTNQVQSQLTSAWDPVVAAELEWEDIINAAAGAAYGRKYPGGQTA